MAGWRELHSTAVGQSTGYSKRGRPAAYSSWTVTKAAPEEELDSRERGLLEIRPFSVARSAAERELIK
jgi:hypothetical protein